MLEEISNKLQQHPQIDGLIQKFYQLPVRDQLMLKILVVFLLLVGLFFLVWLPVQDQLTSQEDRYIAQKTLLHRMKSHESLLTNRPTLNKQENRSLLTVISSKAQSSRLSMKRFEPVGSSAMRVWFESVPFNQLIIWLDKLSTESAINVRQINIDRLDDQPGMANARIVLER